MRFLTNTIMSRDLRVEKMWENILFNRILINWNFFEVYDFAKYSKTMKVNLVVKNC